MCMTALNREVCVWIVRISPEVGGRAAKRALCGVRECRSEDGRVEMENGRCWRVDKELEFELELENGRARFSV